MDWAERRKLAYIGGLLLCVGLIGYTIIHRATSKEPSCFDGKKNGTEVGIDCGGGCTFYCPNELIEPKVRWVRSFTVAPGIVHAVAYIEHSNIAAAARVASYEFKLYDDKNNLITTRTGTTYIGPFGRTAIVEPLIPVGNTVPTITRFSFTGEIPWERSAPAFSQVVIKTDRQLLETFSGGTRLTVTLENQSSYSFTNMDVDAILYDKDDNAIAVSKSFLSSLPSEEKKIVYFTWPDKFKDKTARVEIIPRINPFTSDQS